MVLAFIPIARGLMADVWDAIFKQTDDSGNLTSFSIAAKGILITVVSVAAFVGTGWLILSTNVGRRLGFLITGPQTRILYLPDTDSWTAWTSHMASFRTCQNKRPTFWLALAGWSPNVGYISAYRSNRSRT